MDFRKFWVYIAYASFQTSENRSSQGGSAFNRSEQRKNLCSLLFKKSQKFFLTFAAQWFIAMPPS
ncbi:hypothetical protein EDS67_03400 [candidate division KSB1 bacterium]|nr:MAG: hypothetical protein EDS67_03400 [candidate division KSB1 bacterium]MBC6950252.1 hypothetical protein [candidate division KSB1 bacterium]MCE7939972.1 hypothetical protein [Chlorobi bacterium CHB1]